MGQLVRSKCLVGCCVKPWISISQCNVHNYGRKRTHYEVLEISEAATTKEIRDAFVKHSKLSHPDYNPSDPNSHNKFVRINEAYATLSKPISRREYDFELRHLRFTPMHSDMRHRSSPPHVHEDPFHAERQKYYEDGTFYDHKKRDPTHNQDNYYGFRDVPKQPNSVILGMCVLIMGFSMAMFLMVSRYSYVKRRQYEAAMWRENKSHFVKEKANGDEIHHTIGTHIGHQRVRSRPTVTYDPQYIDRMRKQHEEELKDKTPVRDIETVDRPV